MLGHARGVLGRGRAGSATQDGALLAALADLATIAIHNAELIRELGRSREETSRRAETERTLREIAARVTAIRDPDAILGLIVDETRRVLASDGAHLTRMSDDRTYLTPVVVAGGMDDETRDWLRTQQFPIDGGINGLAAGQGRVVWTPDYTTDPRIPRDAGRPRGRRADGPRGDGGRPAARPRRRGHRHARGQLPPAGHDRARPPGHPPGPRRPCRHRPVELGPARAARGVGGELPRPRPDDART